MERNFSKHTDYSSSRKEAGKKFVTNHPDISLYMYTATKDRFKMQNITRRMVFLIEELVEFIRTEELVPQAIITAVFLLFLLLAA